MRGVVGLACLVIAVVAAYATYALLVLTLTPQDSGVSATGEWGYALVPAVVMLGAGWAGIKLLRHDR